MPGNIFLQWTPCNQLLAEETKIDEQNYKHEKRSMCVCSFVGEKNRVCTHEIDNIDNIYLYVSKIRD